MQNRLSLIIGTNLFCAYEALYCREIKSERVLVRSAPSLGRVGQFLSRINQFMYPQLCFHFQMKKKLMEFSTYKVSFLSRYLPSR